MYNYSDIRVVHLEITSKCNASCPMCSRNLSGGQVNPKLPLTELGLDDIKKAFPKAFIKRLERLYMCGNFGDPLVAKDTLNIFRYLRELNPKMRLDMFTNASGRPVGWWQELAELNVRVRFGVDGLEKTNHLYRRGTNFSTILKNMKTFTMANGWAEWDFLVFKHNEHEVEPALRLAEELGFKRFRIKRTLRFFDGRGLEATKKYKVFNKQGELEYFLEPPTETEMRNPSVAKKSKIEKKHGSLETYLDQTKISCKVQEENSIYLSAEGLLFPCCWTAGRLYQHADQPVKSVDVYQLIADSIGDIQSLNIKKHSLKKVLSSPFFQQAMPQSWQKTPRIKCCEQVCGKEFKPFDTQFLQG